MKFPISLAVAAPRISRWAQGRNQVPKVRGDQMFQTLGGTKGDQICEVRGPNYSEVRDLRGT